MDEWIEIDDDSPEALLAHFTAKGWGDGLPLVPPTKYRVDSMLASLTGAEPLDPDDQTLAPTNLSHFEYDSTQLS